MKLFRSGADGANHGHSISWKIIRISVRPRSIKIVYAQVLGSEIHNLSRIFVKILINGLMHPLASSFAKLILDRLGLRYVNVSVPQRIGHLALEGDCFLRDTILKTGRPPLAVMVEPTHGGFANPVLADYFSRYITIIPRLPRGHLVEKALADNGYAVHTAPYAVAMYETALSYDVFRRWDRRAPLFTLTSGDRAKTSDFLRDMGVREGAWFVCVHARAGGYSPSDEHWHAHRNVDINDYAEAMDRILERGGWCVRMGDATMDPMPPRARVIDYARSPYKSPRLDIGLTGSCRFFLGCASGLYNVAAMFGRPSALANVTPLSGAYALGVEDLAIPQGIADADGRMLSFAEIFASKVADFRLAEEFKNSRLTPRNVSAGEIAALTVEMMDRLDGVATYTPDDDTRQDRFRMFLRPGHYAYGTGSRIGRDYLRTHMPLDSASNGQSPVPASICSAPENTLEACPIRSDRQSAPPVVSARFGPAHSLSERVMSESETQDRAHTAQLYGVEYYASHCGPVAYDRSRPEWAPFFGNIADELIRVFRPHRVFDAGCAHGFLVEALWDRGVETWGRDISDYAISQVRQDLRSYCSAGSLVEPIAGRYDLLTCIEVLEHLDESDGLKAIANLTRASDMIVFSSSPSDFEEPTHFNVRPPLYWIKAFAEHGFVPTINLSLPSITPHAIVFGRSETTPAPEVLTACAELVRCRIQMHEDRHRPQDPAPTPGSGTYGFDAGYYARVNPDVVEAGCDPLEHYVKYGRMEGRYPNPAVAAQVEDIVAGYHAGRED